MVSRLIDIPFTKGIDESVDETVLGPPGMVELVNYRLTRAGRLEHRLGVADVPLTSVYVNSAGDRPSGNKAQGLHGRFLAAGGHGYVASANDAWACVGSLPRFSPENSWTGLQLGGEDFSGFSCASVNGYLVVAGTRDTDFDVTYIRVFDERSRAVVFQDSLSTPGGTPDNACRVVACGDSVVVVRMDLLTGDLIANRLDLATLPLAGLTADVTLVTASASSSFDAAPYDDTSIIISYRGAAAATVSRVTASPLAIAQTGTEGSVAAAKLTTCVAGPDGDVCYLAWLDLTTRDVCCAVFGSSFIQIGTTQTLGNAPGTGFSASNFKPVIGERSPTSAVVGWTDAYNNGAYDTLRTTFRDISDASVAGTTYGPVYGYYLASKPFLPPNYQAFFESTPQPAVWLANLNANTNELDRSYFLMLLGVFSREFDNEACSWEMSALPSAAVDFAITLSRYHQVSEVVMSTDGESRWQTVLPEAFRGLTTANPQRRGRVMRFLDAAVLPFDRTSCIVPCQGSFAVLGGAPRYFDGARLVEIGVSHGISVQDATPDTTGSMTGGGTYRYVFVLETYDAMGQRSVGYVSSPYTVTLGALDGQVNFELAAPAMWAFPNTTSSGAVTGSERDRPVTVRAYRTGDNGTVFRYAADTSSPNGVIAGPLSSFGRVSYQDVNNDADIADEEAVYVQVGNAVSNYRAPPCRFGCEHEGRLIVAGGWDPTEYVASKLFFPGEGIQFTESPAFRDVCPEPITGMASLDGSLVLFGERAIYIVTGDGPTDDGIGSFSKPRRLPGVVGCIDWRSVAITEAGVYFRSREGIFMLPRGLAAPVFVGAAIRNKLRLMPYTLGSAVVARSPSDSVSDCDPETSIAWLVSDDSASKIYVFSPASGVWTEYQVPVDGFNTPSVIGRWYDVANGTDVFGFARDTVNSTVGSLLVENPGSGHDQDIDGTFEPLLNGSWRTGKIFPFGFGGRGSIRSVRLVGDCLSATTLTPTVYSDVDPSGYASGALSFASGRFAVEVQFRRKDISWIQVAVADPTTGSGNRGAGLRFNGLALEVEMEPGLQRSTPTNRSV